MSFCAKKKNHKIPYEQMPLEVSDNASESTRSLIQSYKQGYQPEHFSALVQKIIADELSALKSTEATEADETIFSENGSLLLQNRNGEKQLSESFLHSIDASSIESIKLSLEKYILEVLNEKNKPLLFSSNAENIFQPLFFKKANTRSLSNLLIMLVSHLYSRDQIRGMNVAVVVTPGHTRLAYTVEDKEQGSLLFALPNTSLGNEALYFGPIAQLKGTVAVLDFESYVILKALSKDISNLPAARDFVLDQSAKKFRYSLKSLDLDYKNKASYIFEHEANPIASDSEELSPLKQSELSFAYGFSTLNKESLEASYAQHNNLSRREAEERRIQTERNRLGDRFDLEGEWPRSFGGRNQISEFIKSRIAAKFPSLSNSQDVLQFLERDRECQIGNNEDTENQGMRSELLRSWGLLSIERNWDFQEIKDDSLGLCRALISIDDLVYKNTRILEPIYITLPTNPVDPLPENEKLRIYDTQSTLVKSIATEFCASGGMQNIEYNSNSTNTSNLKRLNDELFFSDKNKAESALSKYRGTHNIFSIRCSVRRTPQTIAPPAPLTPPPPAAEEK
ncbi:MAG: hypothetical protein R3A80_01735 [Bdellovibrionota bacterium]